MTLAGKLMYSLMIIIVIINTVNGNCPDDETTSPVVTITNTTVNATPGTVMESNNIATINEHLFTIYRMCNAN